MTKQYNYLGQELKELKIGLINPSNYAFDKNGEVLRDKKGYPLLAHGWIADPAIADNNGFDKRNKTSEGSYTRKVVLKKGTKICRYGLQDSVFTSLVDTDYDKLGLPWDPKTVPYSEYVVKADEYVVTEGKVAPAFDSLGGGVQYVHFATLTEDCKKGLLEEDTTWLSRLSK